MSRILYRDMPSSLVAAVVTRPTALVAAASVADKFSTQMSAAGWSWIGPNPPSFWSGFPGTVVSKLQPGVGGFGVQFNSTGEAMGRVDIGANQYTLTSVTYGRGQGMLIGWFLQQLSAELDVAAATLLLKLYINGRKVAQRLVTGLTEFSFQAPSQTLQIRGPLQTGSLHQNAGHDWVVWNRALTEDEQFTLWQTGEVPRDGLVGRWLTNGWLTGPLLDVSGNNIHSAAVADGAISPRSPM